MAGPVQILVVDDEEPIRNALKKFLQQQQFEVYAAGSGDQAQLQRERMKLERLSIATLEALVNALEAKDPYMRGHSARVADLSATVAHQLGMSEEDVELVRIAGRLHDIGKIGTREAVLNKQGALTPEEFEHVKQHVII